MTHVISRELSQYSRSKSANNEIQLRRYQKVYITDPDGSPWQGLSIYTCRWGNGVYTGKVIFKTTVHFAFVRFFLVSAWISWTVMPIFSSPILYIFVYDVCLSVLSFTKLKLYKTWPVINIFMQEKLTLRLTFNRGSFAISDNPALIDRSWEKSGNPGIFVSPKWRTRSKERWRTRCALVVVSLAFLKRSFSSSITTYRRDVSKSEEVAFWYWESFGKKDFISIAFRVRCGW